MLQTTLCLIGVFLACIYLYYKYLFTYWKRLNVFHPKPSIPLGNFNYDINRQSTKTISDIYFEIKKSKQKFGGFYLLGVPIFMPVDPDLCKQLLINDFKSFHDRGTFHDEEIDPMSSNLGTMPGQKWRALRTKLSPMFSSAKLKMIFPIKQERANRVAKLMDNILKEAEETGRLPIIDAYDITSRFTLDVICASVFGFDSHSLENSNEEVLQIGRMFYKSDLTDSLKLLIGILAPNILRLLKLPFFNTKMTSYFHAIIKSNVEYRQQHNITRSDLMDQLIKLMEDSAEGQGLTLTQIAAQSFVFLIAGFETSASGLGYCLFELAQNLDVQKKVRDELLAVLKKYNGQLTYEALADLTYMEMAINESLRMNPPLSMLNRVCTEDYKVPGTDLIIPKNNRIVISNYGMHYDPEYFPNPGQFRPERFSEQEQAKRHPFAFLPFGQGPRICIGLKFAINEMKLGLAAFLKDFKYVVHKDMKLPLETFTNANMLIPSSKILLQPIRLNKT